MVRGGRSTLRTRRRGRRRRWRGRPGHRTSGDGERAGPSKDVPDRHEHHDEPGGLETHAVAREPSEEAERRHQECDAWRLDIEVGAIGKDAMVEQYTLAVIDGVIGPSGMEIPEVDSLVQEQESDRCRRPHRQPERRSRPASLDSISIGPRSTRTLIGRLAVPCKRRFTPLAFCMHRIAPLPSRFLARVSQAAEMTDSVEGASSPPLARAEACRGHPSFRLRSNFKFKFKFKFKGRPSVCPRRAANGGTRPRVRLCGLLASRQEMLERRSRNLQTN